MQTDTKKEKKYAGIAIFYWAFVSQEDIGYTKSTMGVKVDEIGNGVFLWTDGNKIRKRGRQLLQKNSV